MSRKVKAVIRLNPTQRAWVTSEARFGAMVAGMGAGKSHGLRAKLLARIKQNYKLMTRKTPGVVMAPTFDMVANMIEPAIADDFRLYHIPFVSKLSAHHMHFDFKGHRCYLRLLSAENYDRYMGPAFPFILADEAELCFRGNPVKIGLMWQKMISRLRVPGSTQSFDLSTTPEGFGFTWEWWEERLKKHPEVAADYKLFRCSTYENERNLPPNYIPTLLRDYDPQLIKAYLWGLFVNLTSGAVYHAFDREQHVMAGTVIHDDLPLETIWDFNIKPCTCIIAQYDEPDIVVHRCIQDYSGKGTEEVCRQVIHDFGHHPGPVLVYGDASSVRAQSSSAGKSDRDIIAHYFDAAWPGHWDSRWTRTNPWVPDRYAAVNMMLSRGRVVIDELAEGLISDLQRQTYKPGTREADDHNRTIGHAADAFGYRVYRDFKPARTLSERIGGARE